MTETIIVAILSLIGTLAGAFLANRKTSALIVYRLDMLEEKVNKHNNMIERTYALESRISVDEEKIAQLESYHE